MNAVFTVLMMGQTKKQAKKKEGAEKVAGKPEQPTAEQVALAQLVKGVHY